MNACGKCGGFIIDGDCACPTEPDNSEWAWMKKGSERAEGPYPTRDDAIRGAKEVLLDNEEYSSGMSILVGRCAWLKSGPHAAAAVDIGWVLERMDDSAHDSGEGPPDDVVFEEPKDKEQLAKAEQELERLMHDWAEKWITPAAWYSVQDEEEVVL